MNYEFYIKENSPVMIINDVLDTVYFNEEYDVGCDWNGKIPEDIMMKLLIFGYMNGAYSSRKIEDLCGHDIYFMWLLDGFPKPDHSTISRFRQNMGDKTERVFYAVVKYLLNNGEVSGENLFIDGTKLEANANRYTFVWKKAVSKNEQKLKAKLPGILDEIHSAYGIRFPDNADVGVMIGTLSSLMLKLGIKRVSGKGHHKSIYQKALEQLEEYQEKLQQYERYNSLFDGRNSFSKTDTDATFMRMKEDHMQNGQLKPGYNIQAAVEGEYIIGIDISSERSDVNTLIPFLEKLSKTELFVLKNIICDAGYESEENYIYLKTHDMVSYIKPANYEQSRKKSYSLKYGRPENMEYHETGDIFVCKAGRILYRAGTKHEKTKAGFVSEKAMYRCESCEGCPYRQNCTKAKQSKTLAVSHRFKQLREESLANITTDLGAKLRMNRSIQSEGAFGVLKQNMGFRRFLCRGSKNIRTEMLVLAVSYNIKKLCSKISANRLGVSLFELKTA